LNKVSNIKGILINKDNKISWIFFL
jgi:hypothetical protein